jgi:hypothetical protein
MSQRTRNVFENSLIICRLRVSRNTKKNSWFQTFAVFWMLHDFFWVIPRLLNFICRRFGTLCLFHLHRQVDVCSFHTHLLAYEGGTECFETSTYKIQTPGNYPKEIMQHKEENYKLNCDIFNTINCPKILLFVLSPSMKTNEQENERGTNV